MSWVTVPIQTGYTKRHKQSWSNLDCFLCEWFAYVLSVTRQQYPIMNEDVVGKTQSKLLLVLLRSITITIIIIIIKKDDIRRHFLCPNHCWFVLLVPFFSFYCHADWHTYSSISDQPCLSRIAASLHGPQIARMSTRLLLASCACTWVHVSVSFKSSTAYSLVWSVIGEDFFPSF